MRRTVLLLTLVVLAGTACSSSGSSGASRSASTAAGSSGGSTSLAAPTTTASASTTTTVDLTTARPYDVVVPTSYAEGTPTPLVLLLHGYGATGAVQNVYFGLEPIAKSRGLLYVHPDGTKNTVGKQFWNATDACCAGPNPTVDDDAYLMQIIDQVSAKYTVDPKRIYLVGHSNGGFMSYRMACKHADRIAAIVSLAGETYADPKQCTPSEPVSVMQVQGTGDDTIHYDGGDIGGRKYPGALDTVAQWAELDGCASPRADIAGTLDTITNVEGPDTTASSYGECERGTGVSLWTIKGGPHVPFFTPAMMPGMVDFLLAHPKR